MSKIRMDMIGRLVGLLRDFGVVLFVFKWLHDHFNIEESSSITYRINIDIIAV